MIHLGDKYCAAIYFTVKNQNNKTMILERKYIMKEELKNEIRNYVKINNLNASQADKLIDEYESEQTFTEHDDGSFEMITGNTIEEVTEWLRQKKIN